MRAVVRPAAPEDAEAASAVLRRSITELCSADHRGDPVLLEKWLADKAPRDVLSWLADENCYCVVAEAEGRVAGVGLLERSGIIRLCYAAPGLQRQRIGSSICQALEEKARSWGLARLRVDSTAAARAFYERLGYQPAAAANACGPLRCHPYEKWLGEPRCPADRLP